MALTSIVGLTFIIERGLALRWNKVIPPGVEDAADACRSANDRAHLRRVCEKNPSPLARLLLSAEQHLSLTMEENENALQTRARQEIVRLERGLVILEIVVGIAPLLGLVGTIYGMMALFGGLGQSGLDDNTIAGSRHFPYSSLHHDGTPDRHSFTYRLELLHQKSGNARRGNGDRL